ncbi:MAG TPA: hypothetical protein VK892_17630, partial [Pyrinomonadaceae bacterium]|nr:hypothetical protein [Pyrinomonadaceae bacterium]
PMVRNAAQVKWISIFLCTFLLSFIFVRWQQDFFRLNNRYLSIFGGIFLLLSFLLLFIAPLLGLYVVFQNNDADMLQFTEIFVRLLLLGGFSIAITLFIYRQRFLVNY